MLGGSRGRARARHRLHAGRFDNTRDDALAGATPYLRLFAYARGGTALARGALAAHRLSLAGNSDSALPARIATARFFAENIAVGAGGLERDVTRGAGSVLAGAAALLR